MTTPRPGAATMPTFSPADIDDSHSLHLRRWVESANQPTSDVALQNLPFGRFGSADNPAWRIGVAIGYQVLDLQRAGLLQGDNLNPLMATGPTAHRALRQRLSQGLRQGSATQAAWSACETRTFLQPGDTVTLRAFCQRDGARRSGFGGCAGTVLAANKPA